MSARGLAAVVSLVSVFAAVPAVASAATGAEVADYASRVEHGWAALTDPVTGAVQDKIAPGPHATRDFNYGTLQMADAQLRTAARTADGALAQKAVAVVNAMITRAAGGTPNDPFNQLAVGTLVADGRAGRFPADAWEQIRAPLEDLAARFVPFTGHGFSDPQVFDNWRLIWAAGAIQIANADIVGRPGSISESPSALRAEVARIVNTLVPANGGSVIRTPHGPGKALSDRPDQPLPYHLFTSVLLERIYESDPGVFNSAGLATREQMGNYALTLMAPDGDLTPSGRSIQQSWVLACAADLGAMRAAQGGKDARAWRAFADRAFDRLVRVHGTFADGTIPVIPGLRFTSDMGIADHYSSMSQYNGATLFYLQHAADRWPDHVPAGMLTADHNFLVSDLGPGGPALTWGRSHDVWWAIQGRTTRPDSRATQGIVALKVRTASGWEDKLAARPIHTTPRTSWTLRTRRGTATLNLSKATGTGQRAVMTGHWMIGETIYRPARWAISVHGRKLTVTTDRLRRGEQLSAAVWATPKLQPQHVETTARAAAAGGGTITASGRAHALVTRQTKPGPVTFTL